MRWSFKQVVEIPRRVGSFLVHGSGGLQQLNDQLKRASKLGSDTAKVAGSIGKRTEKLETNVVGLSADVRALATELRHLRGELSERLLQYNLQLGRLARISSEHQSTPTDESARLSARTLPLGIEHDEAPEWGTVGDEPHPDPDGREWLALDDCPMCGHRDRTIVNEWNKLVTMRTAPDSSSVRYDFAVCHGCGVLYATRRPVGSRYRFLLLNFGEVIAKHGGDREGDREFTNPLLNPYPLTDADRQALKRRVARGVYVSDHLGLRSGEYLEGLIKDRFENSVHLDLIGALVEPRGARVLEIRPRAGTISEGLRRLFGATVSTMPIWESQEFLLKEVYGIDSAGLVDYDQFDIPLTDQFDLIVCNHMLTHAVRPQRFFEAVHRHLVPGGHLYFYNEPDDAEFLSGKQSMIMSLNPLHLQAFDQRSLQRALAANGFEVTFHKRRNDGHICLASRRESSWVPMTETERTNRIRAYRQARDRAILRLSGDIRARFAEEWPQIVERSVAEGIAEFDAEGNLRLVAR